ncbi:MAG: hypothetical protein ACKO1J_14275, partial [Tagaea sp.]
QAVVIVWYPLVQLVEAVQLPKRLRSAAAAAPKGWLDAQLTVQAADSTMRVEIERPSPVPPKRRVVELSA